MQGLLPPTALTCSAGTNPVKTCFGYRPPKLRKAWPFLETLTCSTRPRTLASLPDVLFRLIWQNRCCLAISRGQKDDGEEQLLHFDLIRWRAAAKGKPRSTCATHRYFSGYFRKHLPTKRSNQVSQMHPLSPPTKSSVTPTAGFRSSDLVIFVVQNIKPCPCIARTLRAQKVS